MSEPLFKVDPVKKVKQLLGIEEATPQEQQAEIPKPEPEKLPPTTEVKPIESTPFLTPTSIKPTTPEAPLQPTPPKGDDLVLRLKNLR